MDNLIVLFNGTENREEVELLVDGEDLTGASIKFTVRANRDVNEILISLSTDDGTIVITDPVQGYVELIFTAEVLNTVRAGMYDIEVTLADGTIMRGAKEGYFYRVNMITRDEVV
jgi:hypothetical protein